MLSYAIPKKMHTIKWNIHLFVWCACACSSNHLMTHLNTKSLFETCKTPQILMYAAKPKNKNHAQFCIFIKLLAASARKT